MLLPFFLFKILPMEFLLDTIYHVQVWILGYFPQEELTLHLSYKWSGLLEGTLSNVPIHFPHPVRQQLTE